MLPPVSGLLPEFRILGDGFRGQEFESCSTSFPGDVGDRRSGDISFIWPLPVCTARGEKFRSYVLGTAPWSSHCACCALRACVGMICSSGGSIGSGLYIVANQGGSPSGLLTAVRGRSNSPDLVPGRWFGEGVDPVLVLLDGFLVVPEVFLPDDVPGGDDCAVFGLIFVGDEERVFELWEGAGVVTNELLSSCMC